MPDGECSFARFGAYYVCKEQKILSFLNEWNSWNTYIECIGSTYEKFHHCCHRLLVNCIRDIILSLIIDCMQFGQMYSSIVGLAYLAECHEFMTRTSKAIGVSSEVLRLSFA